jgi:hypothetical protein
MGGYYAKKLALGLVGSTWALHFYQHYSAFGEKHEGYASACSWCWLLASKKPLLLCIMVYPTWCRTVTLSCKLRVIRLMVPPCLSRRVSPTVDMVDLQSPCVWFHRANPWLFCSLVTEPDFDKLNQSHPVGHLVDCHKLVE